MAADQRPPGSLFDQHALAEFYDSAAPFRDDLAYCVDFARGAASILDLGCGAGALATRLAANASVTGVDPASGMLDIAKERSDGERVKKGQMVPGRCIDGAARPDF